MTLTLFGLDLIIFFAGYGWICFTLTSFAYYQTFRKFVQNRFVRNKPIRNKLVQNKKEEKHILQQKPQNITVSQFLFESPCTDDGPHCMYSVFFGKDMCKHAIKVADRQYARHLRDVIATCEPQDLALKRILHEYAIRCLCFNHRADMDTKFRSFWIAQIEQWLLEINCLFCEDLEGSLQAWESLNGADNIDGPKAELLNMLLCQTRPLQTPPMPGHFPSSQTNSTAELNCLDWSNEATDILNFANEKFRRRFDVSLAEAEVSVVLGEEVILADKKTKCNDFIKYAQGKDSLFDLVVRPLNFMDSQMGFVYIFRSSDANGAEERQHLKIGYTTGQAEKRLTDWSSKCGYKTIPVQCYESVNARRVEQLVHKELELLGKRRHDLRCQNASVSCGQKHKEWHEVDEAEAVRVVKHWIRWMSLYEPYLSAGQLRPEILRKMYRLNAHSSSAPDGCRSITDAFYDFVLDSRGRPWYSICDTIDDALDHLHNVESQKDSNISRDTGSSSCQVAPSCSPCAPVKATRDRAIPAKKSPSRRKSSGPLGGLNTKYDTAECEANPTIVPKSSSPRMASAGSSTSRHVKSSKSISNSHPQQVIKKDKADILNWLRGSASSQDQQHSND